VTEQTLIPVERIEQAILALRGMVFARDSLLDLSRGVIDRTPRKNPPLLEGFWSSENDLGLSTGGRG